jgi:hypothetical protein
MPWLIIVVKLIEYEIRDDAEAIDNLNVPEFYLGFGLNSRYWMCIMSASSMKYTTISYPQTV